MATILDVITDALQEIGVVDPVDPVPPEMASKGLRKLNQLLDEWNADSRAPFAETFSTLTLTPSLQPHTVGPTGSLVLSSRPTEILSASLVLNTTTPNTYTPITVRDAQWWAAQATPGLTSAIPTDLYYDPTFPNGSLYLWPVPTTAYGLYLQTRGILSQVTLATTFTLPPGYQNALTLTLAEMLAPSYGATVNPQTTTGAQRARAVVFGNNTPTPRLAVIDAGMPGSHGGYFDWRTGVMR